MYSLLVHAIETGTSTGRVSLLGASETLSVILLHQCYRTNSLIVLEKYNVSNDVFVCFLVTVPILSHAILYVK